MGDHTSCADWGYDTHPARGDLKLRCSRLTAAIARKCRLFDRMRFDTRVGHAFMFKGMTPPQCCCILGCYRGDPSCPAISNSNVSTQHDPRVGVPFFLVLPMMGEFETRCEALVRVHNKWLAEKGLNQAPRNALLRFVKLLAIVLQQFLTIHPYKDGNGHSARLLIWVMLCRAGYVPRNWDIDAKQPYADALSAHRSGKPGALESFLLQAIG